VSAYPSVFPIQTDDPAKRIIAAAKKIAATPPPTDAQLEQRAVPRASVTDLNNTDIDVIKERFHKTRLDGRSPFVKALDLIDLPRNTVANALFPGIAADARAAGNTGTLGMGRVTFSDALERLGVENRVARAIVGFVGDTALDPLSYIGPAGWGVKSGGVAFRGGLRKQLKNYVKTGAADASVSRMVRSLGPEAADEAGRQAAVHTLMGKPTSGIVSRTLARVGGDTERAPGILTQRAGQAINADTPANVREQIEAAKGVVTQYGRGTGPAIRIGGGGSEIGHIPFTDFTLQVPAFTAPARSAVRALQIAKDKDVAVPILGTFPDVAGMHDDLEAIRSAADTTFAEGTDAAPIMEGVNARLASMQERFRKLADATPPDDAKRASTLVNLGEMLREAKAAQFHYAAQDELRKVGGNVEGLPDAMHSAMEASKLYADTLRGTIRSFMGPEQRELLEVAKQALGTSDDMIGASVLMPLKAAISGIAGSDENVAIQWIEAYERAHRKAFGQRGGILQRQIAKIKHDLTRGAQGAGAREAAMFRRGIADAMEKLGVPATMYDDVAALASIRAYTAGARARAVEDLPFHENWVVDGKLVEGPMLKRLKRIQSSLQPETSPKLIAALDEIAEQAVARLNEVGFAEEADDLLNSMIRGYMPHVTTGPARRALSVQKGKIQWNAGASRTAGEAKEAFQQKRSTWKYQFQDPSTGRWHEFYEFEMAAPELSPEFVARQSPEWQAQHAALLESINLYKSLGNQAPPPKPADVFELNARLHEGRFSPLTGGNKDVTEFFEEQLPMMMGGRVAMHQRAVARENLRHLIANNALRIDGHKLLAVGQNSGGTYNLPGGGQATIIGSVPDGFGGQTTILRWGGQNYRPLSRSTIGQHENPVVSMLGDDMIDVVLPEPLADAVDQVAAAWSQDSLGPMLDALEKITGYYKTITLFHPSWFIFNLIGDLTLAVSGGAKLDRIVRRIPDLIRLRSIRDNPEKLRQWSMTVNGEKIDGERMMRLLAEGGALDENMGIETALQAESRGFMAFPSRQHKMGMAEGVKADAQHIMNTWAQAYGKAQKPIAGLSVAPAIATDRIYRGLLGPNLRVNQFATDVMRSAALLSHLDDGNDLATASERMARSMFQYSDTTRLERRYLKNLLPFYMWTKNNLGYQLQLLLERPSYIAAVPRVRDALEEAIAGESQVPVHMRPNWMQQALAMQIGADPDDRFALLMGQSVPTAEAFQVIQGATGTEGMLDAIHYFGSQVNPLVSGLFQLGSKREYFSGREIGTLGDVTPAEFVARQIRPVNELGLGLVEGKIPAAFGRSPAEGVGRSLIGGRIQSFSQDRLESGKLREFREQDEKYRRAIRKAEQAGNKARSIVLRAEQLRLYEQMIRAGFAEEVPAKARATLANVTSIV
jgi:hypothetical protein